MESINQTGDSLPPPLFAVRNATSFTPSTCLAAVAFCLAIYFVLRLIRPTDRQAAPWAKSSIPYIGNVLEYGADPVKFLLRQKELLGDVFRVNMVIMTITFCIGPRVSDDHLCIALAKWHTNPNLDSSGIAGCSMRQRKKSSVSTKCCRWRPAVSLANSRSIRDGFIIRSKHCG